jgi:hypothetical protein
MQNQAIRIVKTRLPDGDSNPWSFYFSRQTRCYSIGPRVNRGLAFFSAGQKERFRQEKVWQMGCEGCEGCEALNGFFRIGQLKLRPTLSEWQWPGWPDEFVTKTAQNLAQMHLFVNFSSLQACYRIPWRDSISRSVRGGDETTRPCRQG